MGTTGQSAWGAGALKSLLMREHTEGMDTQVDGRLEHRQDEKTEGAAAAGMAQLVEVPEPPEIVSPSVNL